MQQFMIGFAKDTGKKLIYCQGGGHARELEDTLIFGLSELPALLLGVASWRKLCTKWDIFFLT